MAMMLNSSSIAVITFDICEFIYIYNLRHALASQLRHDVLHIFPYSITIAFEDLRIEFRMFKQTFA